MNLDVPVKINVDVDLPQEVVGNNCYVDKCVWGSRVRDIDEVAFRVSYKEYFSVPKLKSLGVHVTGMGRHVPEIILKLTRQYVFYRRNGYSHEKAFTYILPVIPPFLRSISSYLSQSFQYIYSNRSRIVASNTNYLPETGWRIFQDEERTSDVLFIPISYIRLVTQKALSLPRRFTFLVFCDYERCYPTTQGIWPNSVWIQVANEAMRRDIVIEVLRRYGGRTVFEYIDNAGVEDAGISIIPGRGWAKVTLFLLVKNPEEHVVRLSMLQEAIKSIMLQLEEIETYNLEKPPIGGLESLGLTREDLLRHAKKFFGKKKRAL